MVLKTYSKLAAGLAAFGFGILVLASEPSSLTGALVGISSVPGSSISTFLGAFLVVCGIMILATSKQLDASQSSLDKIVLSSAIKNDKVILRLVKDAVRNEDVQRGLNHLIAELGKGNYEAGLGNPGHIDGTDIFYLRGRNGERLFYHQIGENKYELVGKASKSNEQQVIDTLKDRYRNNKGYHSQEKYSH